MDVDNKDLFAEIEALEMSSVGSVDESELSPESLGSYLKMMLTDKRFEEALRLIERAEFSDVWAEEAISVYLHNDMIEKAEVLFDQMMDSSDPIDDKLKRDRFCRTFVDGLFKATFHTGEILLADKLTHEEVSSLEKIWDKISFLALDISRGGITNKLHRDIVSYARISAILLRHDSDASTLASALKECRPILSSCAEDILSHRIPADEETIMQLRKDHADDFRVRIWCCRIECEFLKDFLIAFRSAKLMVKDDVAKSDDEKNELGQFLFAVSLTLGSQLQSETMRLITQDLGLSGLPVILLKAHGLIEQDENEKALAVLGELHEEGEKNPAWLGMYAQVLRNLEQFDEANTYTKKQCDIIPIPDVLKDNALALHEHGADKEAIEVLEKILETEPDDEYTLHNLAVLYYTSEVNPPKAIEHLTRLIELKPDDEQLVFFLAQIYFETDEFAKSREVLEPLCEKDPPIFQAVISITSALNHECDPETAFNFLSKYEEAFWNEKGFVNLYMTLASSAGFDDKMHKAMQQMIVLDRAGNDKSSVVKQVGLEEIKEILSVSAEQNRKRADFEVMGYLPWVDREIARNNSIYWAWSNRTYPCNRVVEDRFTRDENQIYTTNTFSIQKDPEGFESLLLIPSPQKGCEVVFDISALITLHELGVLERAFNFFSTIYLPVEYLSLSKDKQGLMPHQRSQRDFSINTVRLMVEGRLKKMASSKEESSVLIIDEYPSDLVDDQSNIIGIAELALFLKTRGLINGVQYHDVVANVDQSKVGEGESRLQGVDSFVIGLSTLQTLCHRGIEKVLVKHFDVYLSEVDADEVVRRNASFDYQKSILEKHASLWSWLHDQYKAEKLVFKTHDPDSEMMNLIDSDVINNTAFMPGSLARSMGLPFCADDRVCQSMSEMSFGTPQVLDALFQDESITMEEYSASYLALVEWRYRFIIIPPHVLNHFATSFREALPGDDLKKLAVYIHDCMRDEGLNSSMQPTDPPTPMSARYLITWITNIAEFLTDAWLDSGLRDEQLENLTDWVLFEMLPSVPRTLKGLLHMNAGNLVYRTLISNMLIYSMTAEYPNRLDQAMKKIKESIRMPDSEYFGIATEVLSHVG